MQLFLKPLAIAAVALTATVGSLPASAGSRGDVAAGVVGGLIVGGIVGSAANARPAPPAYYAAPPPARGCGDLRRKAEYNDSIGRYERADYWRDQYRACRASD